MNWRDEWNAIATRIQGVVAAGEFFLRTIADTKGDLLSRKSSGASMALYAQNHSGHFIHQMEGVLSSMEMFLHAHESALPVVAADSIRTFIGRNSPKIGGNNQKDIDVLIVGLTDLACVRAELDYHLSDFAYQARRRSERAFEHLQRSIVADDSVRDRWKAAYEKGETTCESLGAAHLLLHGIWGFKVKGTREATDLVFGEPLDPTEIAPMADAVVLTEWKLVRDKADPDKVSAEARKQAGLYTSGVLGGLELTDYRYIILVTEDRTSVPSNLIVSGVTYRHVNIAVNPSTPSQSARSL